jgi:hypothetical protein
MSRSNRAASVLSPVTKYISWNAKTGKFMVRAKEMEPQEIKFPFRFLVLDMLSQVTGYYKADKTQVTSNMVRQFEPQYFVVNVKGVNGFPRSGFWETLKEPLRGYGGRWTKVIFAMIPSKETKTGMEIAKLELHGKAISAWGSIESKVWDGAVLCEGATQPDDEGYMYPVFKITTATTETEQKSLVLDKELQEYLKAYFEVWNERINEKGVNVGQGDRPQKQETSRSAKKENSYYDGDDMNAPPPPMDEIPPEPTDDLPF